MFEKTLFEYIHNKLHLLKFKEIFAFFLLIPAIPYAVFLKLKKGEIWLVREIEDQARDNGYAFFVNNFENDRGVDLYYVIEKQSQDYQKLNDYGDRIISFGSLRHWAFYLASTACVSSVKRSGPTALSGLVFRKLGIMNQKMFFLGHGITKDNADWLHYENTKFRMFCCGAYPEYEYVSKYYGYPEGYVVYTGGLCRYDFLHGEQTKGNTILIMPTWRMWLAPGDPRMKEIEHSTSFEESNYYKNWYSLLNNEELFDLLEKKDLYATFFLHPSLQKYVDCFSTPCQRITIANQESCDLQPLIRTSRMLVTDYSSVYFDFFYQKKPVVYFQFDADVYRANHYAEGWFHYENNPFAEVTRTVHDVVSEIKRNVDADYVVDGDYLTAHQVFFPIYDDNNSGRTFSEIWACVHSAEKI